jgi:hypothetical protein
VQPHLVGSTVPAGPAAPARPASPAGPAVPGGAAVPGSCAMLVPFPPKCVTVHQNCNTARGTLLV